MANINGTCAWYCGWCDFLWQSSSGELQPIGDIFIRLIKMIVVPIVGKVLLLGLLVLAMLKN